jgi:hypothetical protein
MKTKLLLLAVAVLMVSGCDKKKEGHQVSLLPGMPAQAIPVQVFPYRPCATCAAVDMQITSDNQSFVFNTTLAADEIWILYACPAAGAVAELSPTAPTKCKEETNNSGPMMVVTATGATVTGAKTAEYTTFQAWRQVVD